MTSIYCSYLFGLVLGHVWFEIVCVILEYSILLFYIYVFENKHSILIYILYLFAGLNS